MRKARRFLFLSVLVVSSLLVGSIALAGDDQLWDPTEFSCPDLDNAGATATAVGSPINCQVSDTTEPIGVTMIDVVVLVTQFVALSLALSGPA